MSRAGDPAGDDPGGADPIRVLVNLTWLVPGVVGGSEESTTGALRAVRAGHPEVELHLAVLRPFLDAHPDLARDCGCEVLELSGATRAARVLAEQTWLARRTRELRPDLVHHAGGVVPLRHPGRFTLTVHDLQPLDLPENFGTAKRLYLRAMLGRSARAARVVCVPSRFTADRLRALLGVEGAKVHVVPWSAPLPAAHPGGPDGALTSPPAGDRRPPLLLYPAITYPHKNHLVLLEAFAELRRHVPDARLVLPGGPGPSEAQVRARMARADLAGHVERPGRVPRERLEAWYREATAVVVPSRYEGFGLPALEAMVRGVPVVVADAGALAEVAGDLAGAPAPVDPDDVTAWAAAMQAVVHLDGTRRREVIGAGLDRAGRFSPSATADGLIAAWRSALDLP